jgi:hypothetical protein
LVAFLITGLAENMRRRDSGEEYPLRREVVLSEFDLWLVSCGFAREKDYPRDWRGTGWAKIYTLSSADDAIIALHWL